MELNTSSKSGSQNSEKTAIIMTVLKWSFFALVVSLPLVRPFNLPLFNSTIPATDFIFLAVFAVWTFALILGKTSLRRSRFYLFLFFYAAAMCVSTVLAIDFRSSAIKLAGEFYLLALAVLTFNIVRSLPDLRRVFLAWTIGTTLTFAASLVGFALFYIGYKTRDENFALFQYGTLPVGNFPRLKALFDNANMACNYLSVSLMIGLIADRFGWLKKTPSRILQCGIWFAAFFTFSPGIGGMFLGQGLWNWAKYRKSEKRRFAVVSLIIGAFLAIAFFAATIVHPDTANTDLDWRLPVVNYTTEPAARPLIWQQAIETIKVNPVFGSGLNAEAASLMYTTLSDEPHYLSDAHNTFLSVAVQTGFVGLAAFTLFIIFLLKCFLPFESFENSQSIVKIGLGIAFISAFLYQGLAGSFEDARHLWILIGLLAGFGELNKSET
ncbi:MAG: O-antigen ligase family protein [Pyrinomonadaceae bacterium]